MEYHEVFVFGLFADRSPEYRFHSTSLQLEGESQIAATTYFSYLVIISPAEIL
jgi:hypothetical protein